MMALVARDLTLIARRRGLAGAAMAHALLAAGFMLAWSGQARVPVLQGANLYEQMLVVQWVFMAVAAPWIAARIMADERRVEWARLSALTGCAPSRLIGVRVSALGLWLFVSVAAALPAVLLAQQMSGVTMARVMLDQLAILALAVCAGVVTLHVEITIESRLLSWMVATIAGVVIFTIVRMTGGAAPLVAVSIAGGSAALLIRRADRALWHLVERTS